MKNLTVVLTLVLLFVSSCQEDEVIPKRTDEELIAVILEKITTNETVLEDVFVKTSSTVTRAAIQNALKTSPTKTAFITNMNALVEKLFENEVKSSSEQLATDVFIKFDGIKGESVKKTVSEFVLDANTEDPLVSYSNKVKSLLDAQSISGRGLLVLIAKVVDEEGTQAAPEEKVSLNFDKIKLMYEQQDRVIHSGTNGVSAETDSQMEQILAQEGVPLVAIGLLLPAVQKLKGSQAASMPYWDWLLDVVNPEINGGLNRDIIRRYNAAGFMGALQFLLSDEYKNDNQDLASMLLLRARYQASLMFIWSDIWEKTKLADVMQDRVRFNENVLEKAFVEVAKLVTRKAILDARAASADKAAFVSHMNELVEGIFDREIQKKNETSETYKGSVRIAVGDLDGSATASPLAELLIKNQADPLTAYSNIIQATIDSRSAKQGNTSDDLNLLFTIVNHVTQNSIEKKSFMSVTPAIASDAKKIKDALLAGRNSGADPEKVVEDLRVANNIPKPLMALLIPAVQKVRNYSGTAESADTHYLVWLDSLDPMIASGVTHDVVTKYDAAGYLGALHFFVSDKYRGDNEDYASLLLLKARYHASLTMIWSDLWGK